MAESTALVSVEFHGTTLIATIIDGTPFVALKPICEALGLDRKAQQDRIKRHPVLSKGGVVTTLPSGGGDQQTLMLPLDKLNGWLFGVSVTRVRPELRERLTQYQSECFDVLARHFGAANPAHPALPLPEAATAPNPEPGPAMPFSLDALIAFIGSGLMNRDALLRIANASGMALYIDVRNTARQHTGWGEAVAKQITHDLPMSDLNAIVIKATQELWVRNIEVPAGRPVPQRPSTATA